MKTPKSTNTPEKMFLKRWNELISDYLHDNYPLVNQKKIAALIGVFPDKIVVWRNGTYMPTLVNVITAIQNLNINPLYLFCGAKPKFLLSDDNKKKSTPVNENQEAIQMLNQLKSLLLKQNKKSNA